MSIPSHRRLKPTVQSNCSSSVLHASKPGRPALPQSRQGASAACSAEAEPSRGPFVIRKGIMERVLFGDNQFFGVNHMSEEKARTQAMRFQANAAVIEVLDIA